MRFIITLLLASISLFASGQNVCGHVEHRSPTQVEINESLYRRNLNAARASRAYNDTKIIPVVINVLYSGVYQYEGFGDYVSKGTAENVMELVNDYFDSGRNTSLQNNADFDFVLADKDINGDPMEYYRAFDLSEYPEWSDCINTGYSTFTAQCDDAISSAFGYERDYYLNVFFVAVDGAVSGGTVGGWAKYPPSSFGLFINSNSSASGWALTATHEIGHYLGLPHTFNAVGYPNSAYPTCAIANSETDCEEQGDYVCDTPPAVSSFSCLSLCGNDIPQSFMSYAACSYNLFTPGQIERMHIQTETYRQDESDHGQFLYGSNGGCTDSAACNFNPNATTDDGSCLDIDALGVCGGPCVADVDSDGICDDIDTCLTGDDIDEDGICDDVDPCIGIPDLDNDGVCDDVDPCVGTIDACGICNGPGEIYECGCEDIPEGDCDCNGNQLDALGVCGGPCLADLNGDGICDDQQGNSCNNLDFVSYNGHDYGLVSLGDQCWFNEHLRTTTLNNSSSITLRYSSDAWLSNTDLPAAAYPDYDSDNAETYGLLYNWYAVETGRLCPSGYHVPTDKDFKVLERYLGMEEDLVASESYRFSESNTGAKLREGGQSGFNAALGGIIVQNDGTHRDFTDRSFIWTSTEYNNIFESEKNNAWFRVIYRNLSGVGRYNEAWQTANNKGNGMSVRCLKD